MDAESSAEVARPADNRNQALESAALISRFLYPVTEDFSIEEACLTHNIVFKRAFAQLRGRGRLAGDGTGSRGNAFTLPSSSSLFRNSNVSRRTISHMPGEGLALHRMETENCGRCLLMEMPSIGAHRHEVPRGRSAGSSFALDPGVPLGARCGVVIFL